jgi:hypothetical protein
MPEGFPGVICSVGQLTREPLCGTDILPAAFSKKLPPKVSKVQQLGLRVSKSSKRKRIGHLLTQADSGLASIDQLANKLVHKGKMQPVCAQSVAAAVGQRRELLKSLRTATP